MGNRPFTLSEVLAKSNPPQTLLEHSREAVDHLCRFVVAFDHQVEHVAAVMKVEKTELLSRLFAVMWLHDIGKANKDFQEAIHSNKRSTGVPHSLLSAPFVMAAVPPLQGIPLEAVAVLGHHTPYYAGLHGNRIVNLRPLYLWDAAWAFYQMLPEEHLRILRRPYPFPLTEPHEWNSEAIVRSLRQAVSDYQPAETRTLYCLVEAAIHYGDWLSSGHRSDWVYGIEGLAKQVQTAIVARQQTVGHTFASRVAPGIQSRAAAADGHLVLSAPTGSGKTEAALLWAGRQPQTRLLYLLPTRLTSNAMYERIKEYVGDLAGLTHGTAGLVIGEEQAWRQDAFTSKMLYSSTLMQPATVATVDQLLLSKFNWTHWDLVETSAAQSAVIFDEIHAYDLFTLGLILNAARELASCGARLCFMSATMPNFLRRAIARVLEPFGGHTWVDCPEAGEEQRHTLLVRDQPLSVILPEIIAAYKQGQKVLVAVNAVDTACEIYQALKSELPPFGVMLFHGRFIEMHRRERERQIVGADKQAQGFVAVVTQVVEVSLDIDYDVMFTQAAPIDALVQRFGRVNRKGVKGLSPVYVAQADERSNKVYGEAVIEDAWKLLCEEVKPGTPVKQAEILSWVERQYPEEKWLSQALREAEQAARRVREVRNQLWQIQTLHFTEHGDALWQLAQSRQEQFPSVEIVPERFRQQVMACQHSAQRLQFVARVPAYLVRRRTYEPELGILFGEVNYDDGLGVQALNKQRG
jgi:CRISPR-associated endonuclease/helicase Cas3